MLTAARHDTRSQKEIIVATGWSRYARMKTIRSGVIRLVKRINKNATIPTPTRPTKSFVVGLQRGEVVKWGSI
jgi:hypothetical protein